MNRDTIYGKRFNPVDEFKFDRKVVSVFPDMIKRSVPGYELVIEQIGMLTRFFSKPGCNYYDLGASLGAATMAIQTNVKQSNCRIFAVDNSPDMINQCRKNLEPVLSGTPVSYICTDIRNIEIENAQIVVLNFTLQFVHPEQRNSILEKIFKGMAEGGALIVSEKIIFENPDEQNMQSEWHYAFKRFNGYSDLEISQKRTALENVLIPESIKVNQQRLKSAGFSKSYLWFQCFNFASILAIK